MTLATQRRAPAAAPGPVRMAVLAKRFEGVVGKMQNTLLRTARSGVINTARDFSCCILTADADLLAAGESLPIHVMVGADMMARVMSEFHPELRRGDAYLHNSPYHGCSHAADQSVLVPVIDDNGAHRFTVLAKAHQADIGNSIATTYHATARDVYEEGALIFPAVKVQRGYRDIADIIRMCMMRIRVPEQWRGDYLAALGAARIGERELLAMGAEVGWDALEEQVGAWFDYSEHRMAAALAELPSGRTTVVSTHDPFPGTPPDGVPVRATVTVDSPAAAIEVDLRDNPDCMPCGLNLSEACARTAAMVGVFNGLGRVVPTNAGSFRRVTVHVRDGCVVGVPNFPTSCSAATTTNVGDRVMNAVQRAMAEFGDGFGMAETGGVQTASCAVISGADPRNGGLPFVNQVLLGDTVGAAAPNEDAWLTVSHGGSAGMCRFDSIEVDEAAHPILVRERRYIVDSEGAGRFRGSPACRVEYGPVRCSLEVVFASDGTSNPPLGARHGLPSTAARNYKKTASGELSETDRWAEITLAPGETVIGVSCGGGGYGSPLERDPARVAYDVDEGLITAARGADINGVVLDDAGGVDADATRRRRSPLASGAADGPSPA